jgi:hypothetical protein
MSDEVTICYRPVGQAELDLVEQSGFTRWPPRLPEQPIFYPVTNERYAIELTQWNVSDFGAGYVTRFAVEKAFMDQYAIHCVGAAHQTEWWVPAEDLERLNDRIVGAIEVLGVYGSDTIRH